jgi:hypothetical protein
VQILDRSSGPHVPIVHARQTAAGRALCGAAPFTPWTNSRIAVT